MNPIPDKVGGANVLCYSPIDSRHRFTGNCTQIVAGKRLGVAAGLAICQYPDDSGFYLFGCNADWGTLCDTWHESLDDAREQAEFEYEGVSKTWLYPPDAFRAAAP